MTTEELIRISGFKRATYAATIFLSFRFVNDCVNRVTLTKNPWQIMAKQQPGEVFYFLPLSREIDAQAVANHYIIEFGTGQHLFGVYTIRQALKRIRLYDPQYAAERLWDEVHNYNKNHETREDIWSYGNKKYISKTVVDEILDYLDFIKFSDSHE